MGYETARSLISVTETNTQKQTNSNIEYKVVTCNGLEIKLPKDEKSYSSPYFVGVIEALGVHIQRCTGCFGQRSLERYCKTIIQLHLY